MRETSSSRTSLQCNTVSGHDDSPNDVPSMERNQSADIVIGAHFRRAMEGTSHGEGPSMRRAKFRESTLGTSESDLD
jgi:hypothetical protein